MVKIIEGYLLGEVIGEGNFGMVYRATHKEKPGVFAVKVIPNQKFQQNDKLEIYTNNEIEALKAIGVSECIIRFYTMIKSKSNCYLVYEYCNGGTLLNLLRREQKLDERKALLIFKQLLEAFKVLNKHSIMHRDLKPENIFFTEETEGNGQGEYRRLKLGDFGFCKGLKPDENLAKTMLGSPIYMAPEVLKGESYTTKADIWSLGVILFEMLYGYCPFESRSIASLINTIDTQQVQLPSNVPVSDKTQTLIKRMLAKDYFRRIGWVELFGIKIDENGDYVTEEPPTTANNQERGSTPNKNKFTALFGSLPPESVTLAAIGARSFSVIHDEQAQKTTVALKPEHKAFNKRSIDESLQLAVAKESIRGSSQPKDQKRFYSQNYMRILSTPLSLKKIQQTENPKSKEKLKNPTGTDNNLLNSVKEKQMPRVVLKGAGTPQAGFREERLASMDTIDLVKEQNQFNLLGNNNKSSDILSPNATTSSITSSTNNSNNHNVIPFSGSSSTNTIPVEPTPFNKYRQNIGMGSNLSKFLMDRCTKQLPRNSANLGSSTPLVQITQKDSKRTKLLKIHESLSKTISKAMNLLQQKFSSYKISQEISDLNLAKDILQDCYIVLKIVQERLKMIAEAIKITQTSLLDMASIINYEHIQVQKFIIEMRNQLMRCSMELPNIPVMLQSSKSDKTECKNSFKELLKTRQMVQVIDENYF